MYFDHRRLLGTIASDAFHKYAHALNMPMNLMVETSRFADCAQAIVAPQPANANIPEPKFVVANAYRENFNGISGYDDYMLKQEAEATAKADVSVTAQLAADFLVKEDKADVAAPRDLLREFAATSHETINLVLEPLLVQQPKTEEFVSDSIDSVKPSNVLLFDPRRKHQLHQN